MEGYKGWTLYDEVTLVIKNEEHSDYSMPQAYIVDTKNKKQLQAAINWGTVESYELPSDDSSEHSLKVIEPEIITLKNDNFTLRLLDAAHGSYHGGKLSFWNCAIGFEYNNEKRECAIGIAANLLLCALLQCDFQHGTCKDKFKFARCAGSVGLLTDSMEEYKAATRDMNLKSSINKGKTKKWQLGHNYITLVENHLYMGKVYKTLDISLDYDYMRSTEYIIKMSDVEKETPLYLAIPKYAMASDKIIEAGSIRNYIKHVKENIKNTAENCMANYAESNSDRKSINLVSMFIMAEAFNFDNTQCSLPSRKPGDYQLEIEETFDYEKEVEDLIVYFKSTLLELMKKCPSFIGKRNIVNMFVSTKPTATLSELDIEILKQLFKTKELAATYMGISLDTEHECNREKLKIENKSTQFEL